MIIGVIESRLFTLFPNKMAIKSRNDTDLLENDNKLRGIDGYIL